jgi:uncharacterized protein (DUF2235 family)
MGGAAGVGIDQNIQDGYRFLSLNYVPGDEIYLFGFSRGAYTVRTLAGMMYCSGLLDRSNITKAGEAYELYRNKDVKPRDKEAVDYRKDNGERVPITLLGCFDTVGALGLPLLPPLKAFSERAHRRYKFHDTTLNKSIKNAIHAMAIDEMREVFDVTPMKKNPEAENQKVLQKWFPGEHGCVGGGTKEHSPLSDGALKWMIDSIKELGLGLDIEPSVIPTGLNPDHKCDFTNKLGFFKLAGVKLRDVGDIADDLHETAIARLQCRQDYRPKNLSKILTQLNLK